MKRDEKTAENETKPAKGGRAKTEQRMELWNGPAGMSRTKKIILTALLLAMLVILSRFLSIKTPITKISLAFIPTMLCAAWLGPKWVILLNFLGDIIGATFFPTGPFFIGYTVSTVVAAAIYGLCLYRKTGAEIKEWKYILRAAIAVALVTVIVNMGLNTLWTSITAGKAFFALFATRFVKQIIMVPIHIVVFIALERVLRKPFAKFAGVSTDEDDEAANEDDRSSES